MLSEWQSTFAESILGEPDNAFIESFPGGAKSVRKRLSIYQNNVFHSLGQALAAIYPVIQQLLGEALFSVVSSTFFRQQPPDNASMIFLGRSFPAFLGCYKHTIQMPWLVRIAHFELCYHQATNAADEVPLSSDDFANIESDTLNGIQLRLHPSIALMRTDYPVASIWHHCTTENENQAANALAKVLPQYIIVCRPVLETEVYTVNEAEMCFFEQLKAGDTLAESAIIAGKGAKFDLAKTFAFGIQAGFYAAID